jgi:uncharacterized membrane protein
MPARRARIWGTAGLRKRKSNDMIKYSFKIAAKTFTGSVTTLNILPGDKVAFMGILHFANLSLSYPSMTHGES